MTGIERIGLLTKEERQHAIGEIIGWFLKERGEEIGVIAAEELLDFMLQEIGGKAYDKALEDVRKLLREQADDLDFRVSELKR